MQIASNIAKCLDNKRKKKEPESSEVWQQSNPTLQMWSFYGNI